MKMISPIIALMLMSCIKDEPLSEVQNTFTVCNRPSITTTSSTEWLDEDEQRIPVFIVGCKRHYSKHHCPSRVLKTKQLSYQVTCKREK